MATVFAVFFPPKEASAAVGLAVPFALLGQYLVTYLFTRMSPMMAKADRMATDDDTKGLA